MTPTRPPRRGRDFSQELADKGWYHSFELPDGTRFEGHNTLEILRDRYARFPLPADLNGRRVLDIGAWDGWFSFEAERRGADVTAIDCVEIANFLRIHKTLGSKVSYRILDFYDLPEAGLGQFDFVFFLGVLYHLKHPLLALEMVCALTTDTAIIESFVTDGETWREHRDEIPTLEFYETDELGNQLDNWFGPSVSCLMAMCRAAGFARVEPMHATGLTAGVACFRHWEPAPETPAEDAPDLTGVANNRTLGINFASRKEEYLSCWFRAPRAVTREELRLEVGGYGIPALYVRAEAGGGWMANFRLPPGLTSGWHDVRLRFASSGFGQSFRIAVDMPPKIDRLAIQGACDSETATPGEVAAGSYVSCWVAGLPENADRANTRLSIGETPLGIDYIGEPDASGVRQINAAVPIDAMTGALVVECGSKKSEGWPIQVIRGHHRKA
jgi:tRNA (mo5U34)-methyltransferase